MCYNGLNLLRGIAAFGIVGCHLSLSPRTSGGEWVTALCDFNVGVFAAISGFLMTDVGGVGFIEYVKKRAYRLLPTYFAWSLIYIAATALYDLVIDGGHLNERYYSIHNWIRVLFCGTASAHLWFLICLFYAQIFFRLFVGALDNWKVSHLVQRALLAMLSVLLLFGSISSNNWYCMYPIRLAAFLLLGFVMKGWKKDALIVPSIWALVMVAIHLGMHGIIPGFIRDYLLVIPVMLLFLSDTFKGGRVVSILAATSMGVYLIHPLFARGVSYMVGRIFAAPYDSTIVIVVWIFIWVLSFLVCAAIRRIPLVARFVR